MLAACLLAALPWLSAVSAADSHCSDFDEDTEETSLLLTHSTRSELGGKIQLGAFDKSSKSGFFEPTPTRYHGKKIFFSKNSCATVLYCLKSVYGPSDDTSAWGRQSPATKVPVSRSKRQTVLAKLCALRPTSRWCMRREPRSEGKRLQMPGDRALGPDSHKVCREFNYLDEGKGKDDDFLGCSVWMQPFMNQLALTLGSSSEGYNLFLDFGSGCIFQCLAPQQPDGKYNQKCVDECLDAAIAETNVFLFFPDWYCGLSCDTEVRAAIRRKEQDPDFEIIELDWNDYFHLFKEFKTPPNPGDTPTATLRTLENELNEWEAGSRAGLHILQEIQLTQFSDTRSTFIPDAECWESGLCASGERYAGYTTTGLPKCPDNRFCGCLSAGQCTSVDKGDSCCSKEVEGLPSGQPCFKDFHQSGPYTGICA